MPNGAYSQAGTNDCGLQVGVLAPVDRNSGTMRTFTFDRFSAASVLPLVLATTVGKPVG
jgi:hypothetical protein